MTGEPSAEALLIGDTGFPKFEKDTAEVAHQYSWVLGKVGNCQIRVSINTCSDEASCPLDWRLFIPEEWDEEGEFNQNRRSKAKLPKDVHHA
jgi:SRSO17 transposase